MTAKERVKRHHHKVKTGCTTCRVGDLSLLSSPEACLPEFPCLCEVGMSLFDISFALMLMSGIFSFDV